MRDHEINSADDMTTTERAWMDFLRAHTPEDTPEPTLRFVRILIGICERRAKQRKQRTDLGRGMAGVSRLAGSRPT